MILWETGLRWWSKRTGAHFLSRKHQSYNQWLNNHQYIRVEITRKNILHLQTKKSHIETVGGTLLWYKQFHIHQVATQRLENNYCRGSPTGVRILRPTSVSHAWGCGIGRRGPQNHLALKASRAHAQECHRTGGNRDSTLGEHTGFHVHWFPGQNREDQ